MRGGLMCAGVAGLVLAGCVEYDEEWRFEASGAGRVRIACQPSAQWRAAHKRGEWDQAAKLFMPPYHALSQMCAQAGVRIERCRFDYNARRGVPRMELLLAFDALPQIARCRLFADREMQWRRNRNMITFLHTLHAYPAHIMPPRDGLMHPEWFADGKVSITTVLPGKIVRAEGGRCRRRVLTATATLNDLARGGALVMLAEARVAWRWWWVVWAVALGACAGAGVLIVVMRRRRPAWRVE